MQGGTLAVVARVLAVFAVSALIVACDEDQPSTFVVDDFESGALTGWQAVRSGSGGWFVYSDGDKAPDPSRSDVGIPFQVADPPQGTHATVADTNGPGTRILYRDLRLDGRFKLHITLFYATLGALTSAPTLGHDTPEPNQQFRVDFVRPAAPIDSLAKRDVLLNVFHTASNDWPPSREPSQLVVDVSRLAGQTVRLRIVVTDNRGPLRAGVDDIRFERVGTGGGDRVELLDTPKASRAVDLALQRLTEADALAALSRRAEQRARSDAFSGAALVARHGQVLLQGAWGLADRKSGTRNTPTTKFRLGSMNKMFTAVAALQLVEAGKLALDEPIGRYIPDYPNEEAAAKVTVRHLLTHSGGTGDIFGPEFEQNRLKLRTHGDYVRLYGPRRLSYEPGARFEYSNYGFVLLGALIEAVSGVSYYDYVRDNIFRPAGMTATDSLPESVQVPRRAVGYTKPFPTAAWEPNADTLPWRGTAAGGGYSTAGDLLRFALALESGKLISRATLANATRASPISRAAPATATREHREDYGYGFAVQGQGSLRSYGHSGGAPGMNGELLVYPELGYIVISLSNLDPPAAGDLVEFFSLRMPSK